jgi:hypothetical protein
LNEDGSVLAYSIVSSDKREEVYKLLVQVWSVKDRKIITECVYTDNSKVDAASIHKAFDETKPQDGMYSNFKIEI